MVKSLYGWSELNFVPQFRPDRKSDFKRTLSICFNSKFQFEIRNNTCQIKNVSFPVIFLNYFLWFKRKKFRGG